MKAVDLMIVVSLAWLSGCSYTSKEPYHSELFSRPPEVYAESRGYSLCIYENELHGVTVGSIDTEEVEGTLHVYVDIMISAHGFRRSPRTFPIRIPASMDSYDVSGRLFWRDPDGALHQLQVVRKQE